MTTFSSVPAVKAALTDGLDAALTTQVSYGAPGLEGLKRESVWLAGLAEWDVQWMLLDGGQSTDDTYTLELNVLAGNPTATSFRATTDRVFAIADQVNTTVRALTSIPDVLLLLPLQLVPRPAGFQEFFSSDQGAGRVSLLQLGVRVRARMG